MSEEEAWCAISLFPHYGISNYGRFHNYTRDKPLKTNLKSTGYLEVQLQNKRLVKWFLVHRLVAIIFLGIPAPGLEINHLDGDKTNNWIGNLEWTTKSKNIQHAYDKGLHIPPNQKPVMINETGEIYPSQSACARAINRKLKQHKGYTFSYAT